MQPKALHRSQQNENAKTLQQSEEMKALRAKPVDFPPAIDIKWTEKLIVGGQFTGRGSPPSPSLAQLIYLPPLVLCLGQKEEGKVQGQLNHTDSSQYIRDLKSQITELKHEVSWGQSGPCSFLFCSVSYH